MPPIPPKAENLLALSQLFGCSVDYLLGVERIPDQRYVEALRAAAEDIREELATQFEGAGLDFVRGWQPCPLDSMMARRVMGARRSYHIGLLSELEVAPRSNPLPAARSILQPGIEEIYREDPELTMGELRYLCDAVIAPLDSPPPRDLFDRILTKLRNQVGHRVSKSQ
ncbi:MAG: hypothetical protein GF320_14265 [Armatimonadia bacterium]|nr:hypothetical protein [Armatimonadia bacterium]